MEDGVGKQDEVWGIAVAVNSRGARVWPAAVKEMAVRKITKGVKARAVAREIGITDGLIHKWMKSFKDQDGAPDFVELLPPEEVAETPAAHPSVPQPATAQPLAAPPACVIRLGLAEVVVPPGFPTRDLTGILSAVKAAI